MVRIALCDLCEVSTLFLELREDIFSSLLRPIDIIVSDFIFKENLLQPIAVEFTIQSVLYFFCLLFEFRALTRRYIGWNGDIDFLKLRIIESVFSFKPESLSAF